MTPEPPPVTAAITGVTGMLVMIGLTGIEVMIGVASAGTDTTVTGISPIILSRR
jgi:hypothetical protein